MRPIILSALLVALVVRLPLVAADPPVAAPAPPTAAQIAAFTFDDVEEDRGFVTPVARDLDRFKDDAESAKRFADWRAQIDQWAPGTVADLRQRVINLLAIAALSDLSQGEFESEAAYVVFEKLRKEVPADALTTILAGIVLVPDSATYPMPIPDLGLEVDGAVDELRLRGQIYAKKLLGRVLGKLPPKDP